MSTNWIFSILLLFLPIPSIAADYSLSVDLGDTQFRILVTATAVKFNARSYQVELPIHNCNRKYFNFSEEILRLRQQPFQLPPNFPIRKMVYILSERSFETDQASPVGLYLRSIPGRMPYLETLSRLQCKK